MFQAPTIRQLQQVADSIGVTLSEAATAKLHAYMEPMAASYEYLDDQEHELPAVQAGERPFRRPNESENPFGAWYVKANIKHRDDGLLAGRTLVVKDNIFVANIPMMVGTSVLDGLIPDYDATVVSRALDAGAEIVGKSVCECLCVSGGSATAATGPVRNPHNTDYSTGGSSSGSAALVVAGEVDLALGTDQGGSVRIPASWSGAYGMKGTRGLVPYTGGMVMETSLDYIGPITSSVSDNALLLDVLAQSQPERSFGRSLGESVSGLKIALVREGFGHALSEADVDECVRSASKKLSFLGAQIEEVSIPEHLTGPAIWGGVVSDGFWQSFKLNGLGYNYDGVYSPALHAAIDNWSRRFDEFPVTAQLLLMFGRYLERYNGYYYGKSKNLVRRLSAAYDRVLADHDLLLMPTTVQKSSPNPDVNNPDDQNDIMAQAFNNTLNTCQFNATGHPAMSVPCGMRGDLPIGMMLVGRRQCEHVIYRAAHHFERKYDWQKI